MSFEPNRNIFSSIEEKLRDRRRKSGLELFSSIKDNCPVDSGRMKNSLSYEENEKFFTIKSEAEYSANVEFGTRNQAANPFMREAINKNKNKIKNNFKDII